MKKVLIDIYHLPQFNFFKHAILKFDPDEVELVCVNRGKLLQVIQHELPRYPVTCIGDYKHNRGMFSMIFRIILPRMFRLFRLISRRKHRFVLTANYQANFVAKIKGIPNIAFNDDPRKFVFPFLKFSADEVYIPPFGPAYKNVETFNALKEWAYLSPNEFTPNLAVLALYGLEPKRYIFIREVSTKTSNYLSQQEDLILSIAPAFPSDWRVVLSLENKANAPLYPSSWTILEEPVPQIHSLLYYSAAVISSGDSMAREGAMLGVASIYAGNREMPANDILIAKKMLLKRDPADVVSTIKNILESNLSFEDQEKIRKRLLREWDDVTALILRKVKQLTNVQKINPTF